MIVDSYHWNVKARSEVFSSELGAVSLLEAGRKNWQRQFFIPHVPRPLPQFFSFYPKILKVPWDRWGQLGCQNRTNEKNAEKTRVFFAAEKQERERTFNKTSRTHNSNSILSNSIAVKTSAVEPWELSCLKCSNLVLFRVLMRGVQLKFQSIVGSCHQRVLLAQLLEDTLVQQV